MSKNKPITRIALTLASLIILASAALYFMQIHEGSEALHQKMTATRDKTILMAAMMAGGIQWNKPLVIENVHATYAGSEIGDNLTDVLATNTNQNELYSSTSESEVRVDLSALLKTHRSAIDNATHFSVDTGSHMVTMVSVFDKKNESVGYVAMAWIK